MEGSKGVLWRGWSEKNVNWGIRVSILGIGVGIGGEWRWIELNN